MTQIKEEECDKEFIIKSENLLKNENELKKLLKNEKDIEKVIKICDKIIDEKDCLLFKIIKECELNDKNLFGQYISLQGKKAMIKLLYEDFIILNIKSKFGQYSRYTKKELKKECEKKNIKCKFNKEEMIKKLLEKEKEELEN